MPPPPTPPAQPAPQAGPPGQQAPPPQEPVVDEQAMQQAMPPPPSLSKGTPLQWKPWFDANVHKQEFLKWANGDTMQELLGIHPELEPILEAHLQEIDAALAQQAQVAMLAQAGMSTQVNVGKTGGGQAMQNSNQESGGSQTAAGK